VSTDGSNLVHIQYAGVHNVADAFIDGVKAMGAMLDQLDSDITSSGMNTYWSGGAQNEYEVVKANWNQILVNTSDNLGAMSEVLGEIATAYNTTDVNISLDWRQIR
jgi:WXG100 family type VII secretion target